MGWFQRLGMSWKISIPVALVLVAALSFLTFQVMYRTSDAIETVAEDELVAMAGQYGNEVRGILEISQNQAEAMANAVEYSLDEKTEIPRELHMQMLKGMDLLESKFLGVGSAWEPDAFDGKDSQHRGEVGSDPQGRFLPYSSGGHVAALVDIEKSDYYNIPKKTKRLFQSEPYMYSIDGVDTLMSTSSAPVIIRIASKV